MSTAKELQEVAFYYPGHLWYEPEWIKNLLLFFDGVALLVPEYKKGEAERVDPVLAGPLREQGLLHTLIADQVVDREATERLVAGIERLVALGSFDSLKQTGSAFHEISMSRMGYFGDEKLADALFQTLRTRGLAKDSADGVSISLHPTVRYTILVLLAQILRPRGIDRGLDLSPATDRFELVRGLTELLNLPSVPSAGHVIAFDLQNLTVDLAAVPLDEVLAFRAEHKRAHRNYVISARKFARELSLMPEEGERRRAFSERQAELDDLASDLKRTGREAWKRPASFALGIAGASWTYATGDPLGALFAAAGTLLGLGTAERPEAGAYSYLFAAHGRYA